jgi:hypothetical protein
MYVFCLSARTAASGSCFYLVQSQIGFRDMRHKRPNQALERTADRRDNLFSMTSTLKPEAQLAFVSGRSAFSR